ncbi:MAG: minor capsid protein [Roseburia sp.]|nr:minor capsid protein [Roseburia sp.]
MAELFEFKLSQVKTPGEEEIIQKFGLGTSVQNAIDVECIKQMEPYTPIDTGALRDNPILNSTIGSGAIFYKGPYARKQYYIPMNHDQGDRYWFEKMKKGGGTEKVLKAAKGAVKK